MLERLICLAFLSLFATSVLVAYVQADDTESGEELQQPAELTALKGMLEAMNMGAELGKKAPDNIDTETDKDSATQTSSASVSATATASESVSESLSDSAASPATKPDPE